MKTEADEKAALNSMKHGGMLKGSNFVGSRKDMVGMLEDQDSAVGVSAQEGMAVVTQINLADMIGIKHVIPDAGGMADWSPFKRTLGEFFNEAGPFGGFKGVLFAFSPQQVEALVIHHIHTLPV